MSQSDSGFTDMKSEVFVHLPNIPEGFAEMALRRSMQKFFRDTMLLEDDLYITAECGIDDYVLDLPEDRAIVQVKGVWFTNNPERHPLVSRAWQMLRPASHKMGNGFWIDLGSEPPTLRTGTVSNRGGKFCMTYVWVPSGKDCCLAPHMLQKYSSAIVAGALAYLFMIPTDLATQNMQQAAYWQQEFRIAISVAGAEQVQNHTDRPIFMQGRSFI